MIHVLNYGPHVAEQTQNSAYVNAIEEDFEKTWRYLDPHPSNFGAFSNEFARLILDAGSMTDVLAKRVCEKAGHNPPNSLPARRKIIMGRMPQLHQVYCICQGLQMAVVPWESWGNPEPTTPEWWDSYNKIKHHRSAYFFRASFENAFHAIAGCVVLLNAAFGFGGKSRLFQTYVPPIAQPDIKKIKIEGQ